ncbi:MAG: hypothetical protein JSU65_10060 [Candidatus Zixiibacteriota bacterium]|nr:MAG: hypothetical protein JSU65_10060 [candidate division Zixibacteria bacterium]
MNRSSRIIAVAFLSALLLSSGLSAQEQALWGELEPGPYPIGFETIEKYDYTRTFRSGKDYFGNPTDDQTARQIQICIWYPAAEPQSMTEMVYAEYAFPFPDDPDFIGLLSGLQTRELQFMLPIMGNDRAAVQNAMDFRLRAVRGAGHQEGTFPVIIYHPDAGSGYAENVVMCEFLASHGFIVATSPALGAATLAVAGLHDLEACARDREFVAGQLRDYPNADGDRVGLLGHGAGGITALVHQMRNAGVDAVATIQGAYLSPELAEVTFENPFFRPTSMGVPMLQIFADLEGAITLDVFDSLRYCDRLSVSLSGVEPSELLVYGHMSAALVDTAGTGQDATGHEAACRYVANFFKAHLVGDSAAQAFLDRTPEENQYAQEFMNLARAAGEDVPPTAGQFLEIIQNYTVEQAMELVEKFDLANPAAPILPEANLNALGYQFLQRGNTDDALPIFKMTVNAYPNSANAHDSYAEACMSNGDNEMALQLYEKALGLLATDSTLTPAFREVLETGIPDRIERLKELISGSQESDTEEEQ